MANQTRKPATRNDAPLLHIERLACRRGERLLFSGLELTLEAGEAVQLTGANGRGKTTLLRTICGLQRPDDGNVSWRGRHVHDEPDTLAGECLYLAHESALNPDLTPRENLTALARLHGDPCDPEKIASALDALDVTRYADRLCRYLSAGQRRRAALARLPLSRAPLWLLDEPAAALDVEGRALLSERMAAQIDAGGTILFTTHQPFALPGVTVRTADLPA